MSDFDDLIRQLATNDTKKKLTVGQKVIDYLGDPENPVECEDLAGFIDSLVPWMQSSNFKARSLMLANSTCGVAQGKHSCFPPSHPGLESHLRRDFF